MSCRKTPRRLVTPQFISPAVLFAALAAASSATAANWEIAPRVEAGYRYSDNYHLGLPGTEVEVSGAEADAAVTFRTLDPRTQVEITPRVEGTYFGSGSEDNLGNYFLDASILDSTPRRRIGVEAELSRAVSCRPEARAAATWVIRSGAIPADSSSTTAGASAASRHSSATTSRNAR